MTLETIEKTSEHNGERLSAWYRLLNSLCDWAAWWEGKRWASLLLIAATFLPVAVVAANNWPLTNDEVYTLRIAQQPTIHQLIALSKEIDLHPPMHYLAEREAMRLPIRRDVAARLPSILAGLVFCIAIFLYTERRLGAIYGLVAVGCVWMTPLLDFTWSNRPYALWMAFLWMLFLALDRAREPARKWTDLLWVLLLGLGMVSTHILGVICLAILIVAEAVRWLRRRQLDWALVVALVLPCLFAVYIHTQIHALSKNVFPPSQEASLILLVEMYYFTMWNIVEIVGLCLFGMILLTDFRRSPAKASGRMSAMKPEDIVALIAFFAFPAILFAPAKLENLQFWSRYGMPSIPAMGVLIAWIVARRIPWGRVTALVLALVSVGYTVSRMFTDDNPRVSAVAPIGGKMPIPLGKTDPTLPIVTASPMTFVEMADREPPAIADRVYYLTDWDAAYQYSHYTLFENEDKIARLLNLPTHAEALTTFAAGHDSFYMIADESRSDIWLPRKLEADGWKSKYLGKFVSTYESNDLFLITRGDDDSDTGSSKSTE